MPSPLGRVAPWHFSIDEWSSVVVIEHYPSALVWQVMRGCPHIVTGLRAAGFRGGRLSDDAQRA